MLTIAELFDSFPASKDDETEKRRQEIFDEIVEGFTAEFDPEVARQFSREWSNTSEGVPVTIFITEPDKEWLENPETQAKLKKYLNFAEDRTDVALSVKIEDPNGGVLVELYKTTVTLTKVPAE